MIDQTEPLAMRFARDRLWKHVARRQAAERVLAAEFSSDADRKWAQGTIDDCDRQIARIRERNPTLEDA